MGIISRFKDIMAANINALLDKAEDPEKMIDQLLRNLTSDLAKVKQETAAIMAEESRAEREMNACKKQVGELQGFAEKAVRAGSDEDARRFLQEKAVQEGKLTGLTDAYNLAHTNAVNMRQMHDKLVDDINTLNSRKEMIKGKMAVAKTQQRINKMTSSATNANNSMAAFDRMEAKANAELDKAKAMAELNKGAVDDVADLKAKYGNSGGVSVDDELAALKASMGI